MNIKSIFFCIALINICKVYADPELEQIITDACITGNTFSAIEIIRKLSCEEVNTLTTSEGETLLGLVTKLSSIKLMQLLIEQGADVNKEDTRKRRPLFFAMRSGNQEAIQLLLKHRALCTPYFAYFWEHTMKQLNGSPKLYALFLERLMEENGFTIEHEIGQAIPYHDKTLTRSSK